MSPLHTSRPGRHGGSPLVLKKANIRRHSAVQGDGHGVGAGDASDSSQNTCSTFSCPGNSNACNDCSAWNLTFGPCCTQT